MVKSELSFRSVFAALRQSNPILKKGYKDFFKGLKSDSNCWMKVFLS